MNYISVCSGIEAATVAWKPLGFSATAFAEIEPFPCELLRQKYPVVDYGNSFRSMGIEKGKYLNVEASKTVDSGWIIYRLEKII